MTRLELAGAGGVVVEPDSLAPSSGVAPTPPDVASSPGTAPPPGVAYGDAPALGLAPPIPGKIRPCHRERLAVVYVRQSSPQQVQEHRESAELQYALQRRALAWGWARERIRVIDDDQGCSGATAEGRLGVPQ